MQRTELWEKILSGQTTVRELGGVSEDAMKRMHALGITAFTSGRYAQAASIFAGLEALDRQTPIYALHLAHARAQIGDSGGAIEAFTRFIDAGAGGDRVEHVRALLSRATLNLGRGEDRLAGMDLTIARKVAGDDREANALLEEIAA
jgi:hypothetical protein